ncbi:MAG: adenylate kinase [Bacteroidales bacterium]|jgi:adenylate kinase|nr:adenylate kinase [Bacteroidales bacterium]
MINIALFGPPGAGKGTQSEFLIKEYNLFYISTGYLLRKEIEEQTKLGLDAQNIIAAGGLVPDEIIVQIIEKTIKENSNVNGFLFDGFPRTYIQAYILEGLMIKLNTSLNCLISINVHEEESKKRLTNRGKTSGRSDDNEEVIRNRLQEYNEKTQPVLNFYREKGICFEVDGLNSIDEVKFDIKTIINTEFKKQLFNIVLFGYPGSGRGSQGKVLAEKYGLEYIATGSLLDEEIKNNTEIGKKVKYFYDNGLLVPDEIIVPLIEKKLENANSVRGYIFKGIPRTFVQSYILDGLLKKHKTSLSKIIEIEVPTLELIKRLDQRSQTDSSMPYDSSTAKIVQRLQDHQNKTIPVIEKYNELHGVVKVNGMGNFEEVFQRLCEVIDNNG